MHNSHSVHDDDTELYELNNKEVVNFLYNELIFLDLFYEDASHKFQKELIKEKITKFEELIKLIKAFDINLSDEDCEILMTYAFRSVFKILTLLDMELLN
ncbi:MAG: hypothetical protein GF353_00385 [Candidatus Lokiarchaeota archaeon]|nr:hypothetical protein [Candidatus Lokiarchaeota archaeon]